MTSGLDDAFDALRQSEAMTLADAEQFPSVSSTGLYAIFGSAGVWTELGLGVLVTRWHRVRRSRSCGDGARHVAAIRMPNSVIAAVTHPGYPDVDD